MQNNLLITVLFCGFLAIAASGKVMAQKSIDSDTAGARIVIESEAVDLSTILLQLAEKHDFTITGLARVTDRTPMSVALSGELKSVVRRLLRNWNYTIILNGDAGKIARIAIINSIHGSRPVTPEPIAAPVDEQALRAFAAGP